MFFFGQADGNLGARCSAWKDCRASQHSDYRGMNYRQRQEESRSGFLNRGDFGFNLDGGPLRGKNLSDYRAATSMLFKNGF